MIQVLADTNQYPTPVKKSKLRYIFLTVVSSGLIFAMGITYLFWWAPQVQAKEYLVKTSEDFQVIQEKIQKYEGAFVEISESFKISQGAFYEITSRRNYVDAVADTKKDIEDIEETLDGIKKAVKTKEELTVPESMETLDQYLSDYYKNIEEGMRLLLDFEKLQMDMLDASGDELNGELEKMQILVAEGGSSQKFVDYFSKLESLAEESVFRFKLIKNVPQAHKNYFDIKFEYHEDVKNIAKILKEKYGEGTPAAYDEASENLAAFSNRNIERNKRQKEDSEYFVNNSPIKELFEDSLKLETKIKEEFTLLKLRYKLEESP